MSHRPQRVNAMYANRETIRDAALRLSETDRAWIAESLLDSLSLTEDDWEDEIDRRVEEYKKNPEIAPTWDEVKKLF
jgi:putative addiction module component (TIGR02574 family)